MVEDHSGVPMSLLFFMKRCFVFTVMKRYNAYFLKIKKDVSQRRIKLRFSLIKRVILRRVVK